MKLLPLALMVAGLVACGPKKQPESAAPKVETEPEMQTPDAGPGDVVEETTAPVELERPAEEVDDSEAAPPTELPRPEPEEDNGPTPLPE